MYHGQQDNREQQNGQTWSNSTCRKIFEYRLVELVNVLDDRTAFLFKVLKGFSNLNYREMGILCNIQSLHHLIHLSLHYTVRYIQHRSALDGQHVSSGTSSIGMGVARCIGTEGRWNASIFC